MSALWAKILSLVAWVQTTLTTIQSDVAVMGDADRLFYHALCAALSVAVLTVAVVISFGKRLTKMITPARLLTTGAFLTFVIISYPLCLKAPDLLYENPMNADSRPFMTVVMAILQSARMFLLDSEYATVVKALTGDMITVTWLAQLYRAYYAMGCVLAPILTASFALSFFGQVRVRFRLWNLTGKRVYVFNELSERSMALAGSIGKTAPEQLCRESYDRKKRSAEDRLDKLEQASPTYLRTILRKHLEKCVKKFEKKLDILDALREAPSEADKSDNAVDVLKTVREWMERLPARIHMYGKRRAMLFFFADVFTDGNETEFDLAEKAKEMQGAFCYKRDVVALDKAIRRFRLFVCHPKSLEIFLVAEDETVNVNQAIEIKKHERYCRPTPKVYAVAVGDADGMILDSLNDFKVKPSEIDETILKEATADIGDLVKYIKNELTPSLFKKNAIIKDEATQEDENEENKNRTDEEVKKDVASVASSKEQRPLPASREGNTQAADDAGKEKNAQIVAAEEKAQEHHIQNTCEPLCKKKHRYTIEQYYKAYKAKKLGKSLPDAIREPSQTVTIEELNNAADQCVKMIEQEQTFYVRRVNPMKRLAWKVLKEAQLHNTITAAQQTAASATVQAGLKTDWTKPEADLKRELEEMCEREKQNPTILSFMIVGCGTHGLEFLKTALWLYQLPGYQLEINVIDQDEKLEEKIVGEYPDLLNNHDGQDWGDSQYSLRFYGGVDVRRASFRKVLLGEDVTDSKDAEPLMQEAADRLQRTTVAIVALGDDDLDIEVAVHLRTLFDRLHVEKDEGSSEVVKIISVVYDENKTSNIANDIKNFKNETYNIQFIGDLAQTYQYNQITYSENEHEAYKYHVRWVYVDRQNPKQIKEYYKAVQSLMDYSNYEYYRMASMSQGLHNKIFNAEPYNNGQFDEYFEGDLPGGQKLLRNIRGCLIEHRRWNAYMRTLGYSFYNKRKDRAKYHKLLKSYKEMKKEDMYKDQ